MPFIAIETSSWVRTAGWAITHTIQPWLSHAKFKDTLKMLL